MAEFINGQARREYPNGEVYEGEWKDFKRHGTGKMTYDNGVVYEGEWKDDMADGTGKMTWPSGKVYEGEFVAGWGTGRGKQTWDGHVYEGEWKDGRKHGRGNMTFEDGNVYEGEWKNDLQNGIGKMTYNNSDFYEGEWKHGKKDGIGKMTLPNGQVYEGEWKYDMKHGRGKMNWPNGQVYEGEWKDDMKNGIGKMTLPNGQVYEGEWRNDEPIAIFQANDGHVPARFQIENPELDTVVPIPPSDPEKFNEHNQKTCFDFLNMSEENIGDYLTTDPDNIVIFYKEPDRPDFFIACYTFTRLKAFLKDPTHLFYSCVERKDYRIYNEETPDYIKIPTTSGNIFVSYQDIKTKYMNRQNMIFLEYSHTVKKTMSYSSSHDMAFVSGNHCQEGSEIRVYELIF